MTAQSLNGLQTGTLPEGENQNLKQLETVSTATPRSKHSRRARIHYRIG